MVLSICQTLPVNTTSKAPQMPNARALKQLFCLCITIKSAWLNFYNVKTCCLVLTAVLSCRCVWLLSPRLPLTCPSWLRGSRGWPSLTPWFSVPLRRLASTSLQVSWSCADSTALMLHRNTQAPFVMSVRMSERFLHRDILCVCYVFLCSFKCSCLCLCSLYRKAERGAILCEDCLQHLGPAPSACLRQSLTLIALPNCC